MTDQDTMVYIRNAVLALSRIAQKKGVCIRITAECDGYAYGQAAEYEFMKPAMNPERYEYRPLNNGKAWKEVKPCQIRFGQEPKDHD